MTDPSDIVPHIIEAYTAQYYKVLNINSIGNKKVKAWLNSFKSNSWSHYNRIVRNIQQMKHTYPMLKTSMVTTCFKVTLDDTSCVYAFLYSDQRAAGRNKNIVEPDHKYFCCSPTFRSMDGEYRHRFLPFENWHKIFDKYSDVFEPIEEMILGLMTSGRLTFQADFFYPASFIGSERKFEDAINSSRFAIKMFILCWFCDFRPIHTKYVENHINPAYQYVIYQPEGKPIYEKIMAKLGVDEYEAAIDRLSAYYSDLNQPHYNVCEIEVGQKIFPLTVFEAIRLEDINFNVWREFYINNLCSNLVINLISPSFPFINNWFYIQNSHAGLFDNPSMHDKFTHSDIANDISMQLRNADKATYVSQDKDKQHLDGKFMRLSRYIKKGIGYSESAIRLTSLAACVTSEYVGRTIRDLPVLIVNSAHSSGVHTIFSDADAFNRHMFEYLYGFYCMNSKIKIFHGDLHLNNATVFRLYNMFSRDGKLMIENPKIVYCLQNNTYMFPHYGLFSMIIDFSRATIGDFDLIVHEFGTRFAELYFKEQRQRVLRIVYHYFPKLFNKHRDAIEALLISNFPLMFKILTAVDAHSISINIGAMMSIDEYFTSGKIKIAKGAVALLSKISSLAEILTTENITAAVTGKINHPDDIEYPVLLIIQRCFEDFEVDPNNIPKDANVLDIFNYNNDIKYNMENYDSWGPLLNFSTEVEVYKKHNIGVPKELNEIMKKFNYDESNTIDALISKYEQKEKESLDVESWMFM